MKNHVSFETAKRLKEAGFPQPEPEAGQVWFANEDDFVIVCYKNGVGVAFVFNDLESNLVGISFRGFKDLVFAPTATDILYPSCFLTVEISYKTPTGERWVVYDIETLAIVCKDAADTDNPAEAAALAWLEIHEKK